MLNPSYIVAGDMSADIIGPWVRLEPLIKVGFQAKWLGLAGSAIGTFEFDITCDPDPISGHGAGIAVPFGAQILILDASMTVASAKPASTDSGFFFENFGVSGFGALRPAAPFLRMRYKRTSGTGTLYVAACGIGR